MCHPVIIIIINQTGTAVGQVIMVVVVVAIGQLSY